MKHLIICREYPPAPGGGIGTYVYHISRLLAESGEIVHVIGQSWAGAEQETDVQCQGRLIIHRIPFEDWAAIFKPKLNPAIESKKARALFESSFYPQCFSWQATLLAERLVEQEGIDLVEAQEYEAPLYYFQLRRALGLGPKKQPPCIVHLHSPTEYIARYNDWDLASPSILTAKRLEDYSIGAADALLCPSQYLAHQVETQYGLLQGSIRVIPLPIGDNPKLVRDQGIWNEGTICYVGRLERRKGVIEWLDAAVMVAPDYRTAKFEFIGPNVLGANRIDSEEFLKRRIPADLKNRFRFRGQQKRSDLPQFLANARLAVVPSRWENFPNTCIEAMASGLPVLASPEGGMAEMIKDGKSGWLAASSRGEDLAVALRRALETPMTEIAEMGQRAASHIHQICDTQKILQDHLNFRNNVVKNGLCRSLHLSPTLRWLKQKPTPRSTPPPKNTRSQGLAIVVICGKSSWSLDGCLQRLEQQTQQALAVVLVNTGISAKHFTSVLERASQNEWQVIYKRKAGDVSAKNAGITAVIESGLDPLGVAFLNTEDWLRPDFVATCESVLQRCPEVGLVSFWTHQPFKENKIQIRTCPSFPYQWLSNEAVSYSVIRTEALREAGHFRPVMDQGYEDWDLFNAVLASGWSAVTVPKVLGQYRVKNNWLAALIRTHTHSRMYEKLIERFPNLIAHDAQYLTLLCGSRSLWLLNEKTYSIRDKLELVHTIFQYPGGTCQETLKILSGARRQIVQRMLFRVENWASRTFGLIVNRG